MSIRQMKGEMQMLKNARGIIIRNPNAKSRWQVPMHVGPKHFNAIVPADCQHEAILIAENENAFAVWTSTPCKEL